MQKYQHFVRNSPERQEHLSLEKAHKNTLLLQYLFCQIISQKRQGKADSASLSELLTLPMDFGAGLFSCLVSDHPETTFWKAICTKLRAEAFSTAQVFGTGTTNTHPNKPNKTPNQTTPPPPPPKPMQLVIKAETRTLSDKTTSERHHVSYSLTFFSSFFLRRETLQHCRCEMGAQKHALFITSPTCGSG